MNRFYSLVITDKAWYHEGKQVGWMENSDDLPRYTNYLFTPLPEASSDGTIDIEKAQSFDWEVPSWLTKLRYDLWIEE